MNCAAEENKANFLSAVVGVSIYDIVFVVIIITFFAIPKVIRYESLTKVAIVKASRKKKSNRKKFLITNSEHRHTHTHRCACAHTRWAVRCRYGWAALEPPPPRRPAGTPLQLTPLLNVKAARAKEPPLKANISLGSEL